MYGEASKEVIEEDTPVLSLGYLGLAVGVGLSYAIGVSCARIPVMQASAHPRFFHYITIGMVLEYALILFINAIALCRMST